MKLHTLVFLLFASICLGADVEDAKSWKYPEPITYESLRAWHKAGGLGSSPWPKEHHVDLNNDGSEEVFLGISGYGRGMIYALFTKTKRGWILLSEEIEGSHHDYAVLPAKHQSWHDFTALVRSGHGGLMEFIYTWDGKHSVLKSSREITEKELYGH